MKKFLMLIIIFVCVFAIVGCNEELHSHHFDFNGNGKCDLCMKDMFPELVIGTYYLPYESRYNPTSITFFDNGKCTIAFSNEDKEAYHRNYWIEDGKVYLDIETAPKVHVFTILENALVFDPVLSTANLWDTMALRGPVIYFLPDVSREEILGTTVMVDQGLDSIPSIEKIYAEYKIGNRYNDDLADGYAFIIGGETTKSPWQDKILGTEYTFNYPDSREILVYTQGVLLTLTEAYSKEQISLELIAEINTYYCSCENSHSFDEGVITQNASGKYEILYTCKQCYLTTTATLPESFSFSLTWGFDGYYNSETGVLKNGYNYDLDQACETTLILDQNELMNIYRILYNGNMLDIKNNISVSNQFPSPSYTIKISYTVNGETVEFKIYGASYISYSEWSVYPEFGYAYYKVIADYITSSEEYKELPPNQNLYE